MPKGHFVRSEAHRKAISEALKGKTKSLWAIKRNVEALTGRTLSPEHVEKLKQYQQANNPRRGVHLSDETKAKMSAAKRGRTTILRQHGIEPEEYARWISTGHRWCTYRKHFVAATEFPSKQPVCLKCRTDFYREQDLKRKYGVTHEWYVSKLAEQDGKCAICRRADFSKGDNHFCVDHNHETGQTRGILCTPCNTLVGMAERVPDCFATIIAYLARYR